MRRRYIRTGTPKARSASADLTRRSVEVDFTSRPSSRRMSVLVKGFRMPARRSREGTHRGRRPKSLEGGKRGGVLAGGGVSLWGFDARMWGACSLFGRGRRAREWREGGLGWSGRRGTGGVALWDLGVIWVFARAGGAEGCRRLSVGATGEISASDGSGDGRWRQGCDGHELSSPIDGIGHSRGWQPGAKVSMMIMRPPQQGQAFHSSCSRPSSAPSPSSLDGAGSGTPRS